MSEETGEPGTSYWNDPYCMCLSVNIFIHTCLLPVDFSHNLLERRKSVGQPVLSVRAVCLVGAGKALFPSVRLAVCGCTHRNLLPTAWTRGCSSLCPVRLLASAAHNRVCVMGAEEVCGGSSPPPSTHTCIRIGR